MVLKRWMTPLACALALSALGCDSGNTGNGGDGGVAGSGGEGGMGAGGEGGMGAGGEGGMGAGGEGGMGAGGEGGMGAGGEGGMGAGGTAGAGGAPDFEPFPAVDVTITPLEALTSRSDDLVPVADNARYVAPTGRNGVLATDGTAEGTGVIWEGTGNRSDIVSDGAVAWWMQKEFLDPGWDERIWVSDGTVEGTRIVTEWFRASGEDGKGIHFAAGGEVFLVQGNIRNVTGGPQLYEHYYRLTQAGELTEVEQLDFAYAGRVWRFDEAEEGMTVRSAAAADQAYEIATEWPRGHWSEAKMLMTDDALYLYGSSVLRGIEQDLAIIAPDGSALKPMGPAVTDLPEDRQPSGDLEGYGFTEPVAVDDGIVARMPFIVYNPNGPDFTRWDDYYRITRDGSAERIAMVDLNAGDLTVWAGARINGWQLYVRTFDEPLPSGATERLEALAPDGRAFFVIPSYEGFKRQGTLTPAGLLWSEGGRYKLWRGVGEPVDVGEGEQAGDCLPLAGGDRCLLRTDLRGWALFEIN